VTGKTDNERRHLRYRHPDQQVFNLVRTGGDGREEILPVLIINESHRGFSCVAVGPPPGPEDRFDHQENAKIRTPLVLRHQRRLEDEIHVLGFERTDDVIRTEG
jgi:hypothetical protein